MTYKPRTYRNRTKSEDLVTFEVTKNETDLLIAAERDLSAEALGAILTYRSDIEKYIEKDRAFYSSLEPVVIKKDAPAIIQMMGAAAKRAGVGPMAAVAGAMAQFAGKELLKYSKTVIVENGGDIFIKTEKPRAVGIYAGQKSPFNGKLAIEISTDGDGLGVCTSSGTVSHSLSFGKADAALIIAKDAALADAVATRAGNVVKSAGDIEKGIEVARGIEGVLGVLIIVGDKMGTWGGIKII